MSALRLSEIPRNARARVVSLQAARSTEESALVMRLAELGFIPGERVRVIAFGQPGNEPIAVRIGSSTFGLRRYEADLVQVIVEADTPAGP